MTARDVVIQLSAQSRTLVLSLHRILGRPRRGQEIAGTRNDDRGPAGGTPIESCASRRYRPAGSVCRQVGSGTSWSPALLPAPTTVSTASLNDRQQPSPREPPSLAGPLLGVLPLGQNVGCSRGRGELTFEMFLDWLFQLVNHVTVHGLKSLSSIAFIPKSFSSQSSVVATPGPTGHPTQDERG